MWEWEFIFIFWFIILTIVCRCILNLVMMFLKWCLKTDKHQLSFQKGKTPNKHTWFMELTISITELSIQVTTWRQSTAKSRSKGKAKDSNGKIKNYSNRHFWALMKVWVCFAISQFQKVAVWRKINRLSKTWVKMIT